MSDNLKYSQVEQEINQALNKYGTRMVITYLKQIDSYIDIKQSEYFLTIEKILTDYFQINQSELYNRHSYKESVMARRIFVYMLANNTNSPAEKIRNATNTDAKTYRRYVEYVESVIENSNIDRELLKSLGEINTIYQNLVKESERKKLYIKNIHSNT